MNARIWLTCLWIGSLLAAILLLEAYFLRTTPAGIPFLLASDRPAIYEMVGLIYGANIAAVLAAWFTSPFPALRKDGAQRFVAALALVLTGAYNLLLLYLMAGAHFNPAEPLAELLAQTRSVGLALAFLILPVNAYYFGVKKG
jgi:hypothetical protein